MAGNNDPIKQGAEELKKQAKQIAKKVVSKIVSAIAPYVGIFFLCMIAVGVINLIMFIAKDAIAAIAKAIRDAWLSFWTTYDVDNATQNSDALIVFDEYGDYKINMENVQVIIDELQAQKVDTDTLTNEPGKFEKIVRKYVDADAITRCFKTVDGEVTGGIEVWRTDIDTKTGEIKSSQTKELKFLRYDEFMNDELDEQDRDLYKHFTVDPNTFELIVPVPVTKKEYYDNNGMLFKTEYYDSDGKKTDYHTYTVKRINYQNIIQKYATSFNFFMSMHLVVQDEKFMEELVNKIIEESNIVIMITDVPTTTTEEYEYDIKAKTNYTSIAKMTESEFEEEFEDISVNKFVKEASEDDWNHEKWKTLDDSEKTNKLDIIDDFKEEDDIHTRYTDDVNYYYNQNTGYSNGLSKLITKNRKIEIDITDADTWWYEYKLDIDLDDKTVSSQEPKKDVYTVEWFNSNECIEVETKSDGNIEYKDFEKALANFYTEDMIIKQLRSESATVTQKTNIVEQKKDIEKVTNKNKNKVSNLINLIEKDGYEGVANKIATAPSSLELQFQQYEDTQIWIQIFKSISEYLNTEDAEKLDEEIHDIYVVVEKIEIDDYIKEFFSSTTKYGGMSMIMVESKTEDLMLSDSQKYGLILMFQIDNECLDEFVDTYKKGLEQYSTNSYEHNKYIWENWWNKFANKEIKNNKVDIEIICDKAFETYVKGKYSFSESDMSKITYYTSEELENCAIDSSKYENFRNSEIEVSIFSGADVIDVGGSPDKTGDTPSEKPQETKVGENGKIQIGNYEFDTYTSSTSGRTYIQYYQNYGPWAQNATTGSDGVAYYMHDAGCYATTVPIIKSGYKGYVQEDEPDWGNSTAELTTNGVPNSRVYIGNRDLTEDELNIIRNALRAGKEIIVHVYGTGMGGQNNYAYPSQHWMPLVDINEDGTLVYNMNTHTDYGESQKGWVDIYGVFKSVQQYLIIDGVAW